MSSASSGTDQASRLRRPGTGIGITILMLIVLVPINPCLPYDGIDASYADALNHAFARGWQFGRDVVFTYGPLSFLRLDVYHPRTYATLLVTKTLYVSVLGYAYGCALEGLPLLTGIPLILSIFLSMFSGLDSLFFMPVFLFSLYGLEIKKNHRALSCLLVACCAVSSNVKFNFAILSLPVVLLVDVFRCHDGERRVFYSPVYLLMTAVLWMLAGQHLSSLWPYVQQSLELSSFYSESMQSVGPCLPVWWFVFCSLATVTAILVSGRLHREPSLLVFSVCYGLFCFMAFKAGFVRPDGHSRQAFDALAGSVPVVAVVLLRRGRTAAWSWCLSGLIVATLVTQQTTGPWQDALQREARTVLDNLTSLSRLAAGRQFSAIHEVYDASQASLRAECGLPAVTGTVDLLSYNQSCLLASGENYHPRPVFQSYTVYSPRLVKDNLDFYRGKDAPDNVFFNVTPIDDRFPALEDGALWPVFLSRYQIGSGKGNFLWLKKKKDEAPPDLGPATHRIVRFNESVPTIPDADKVWASLTVHKTSLGRLVNFFYKMPILRLDVTYEDGQSQGFRLVPGSAQAGFLLSPAIRDRDEFKALAGGEGPSPPRVARTVVHAGTWARLCYGESYSLDQALLRTAAR